MFFVFWILLIVGVWGVRLGVVMVRLEIRNIVLVIL